MLVHTDNTTVISYINHQGGLCLHSLFGQAQQILRRAEVILSKGSSGEGLPGMSPPFLHLGPTSFWPAQDVLSLLDGLPWEIPIQRKLLNWQLFILLSKLHTFLYTFGPVLEFLQECLSAGLAPATLKINVAAISTTNIPLDRASVGRHPYLPVVIFLPVTYHWS